MAISHITNAVSFLGDASFFIWFLNGMHLGPISFDIIVYLRGVGDNLKLCLVSMICNKLVRNSKREMDLPFFGSFHSSLPSFFNFLPSKRHFLNSFD